MGMANASEISQRESPCFTTYSRDVVAGVGVGVEVGVGVGAWVGVTVFVGVVL